MENSSKKPDESPIPKDDDGMTSMYQSNQQSDHSKSNIMQEHQFNFKHTK